MPSSRWATSAGVPAGFAAIALVSWFDRGARVRGERGDAGVAGSRWHTGTGAPGAVGGAVVGDLYLDTASGDVYALS